MPRAPKACACDGCETRIIGRTYCESHTPVNWGRQGATRTGTAQHKAWRRAVLDRDHWRCQLRGPRCTRKATEADHIINVANGGAEFDLNNGQAVCKTCHGEKTQSEAAQALRRRFGKG